MPKEVWHEVAAQGCAKTQPAEQLHTVPVSGGARGPIAEPADDAFLHRTLPCRQKPAKAFLDGKSPGVQQRYAPDAMTSDVEGWVEDEETVERLAEWRREAPYG